MTKSSATSKRQRFRYQASGTTNTYAYCGAAARRALEHAERHPAGSLYFRMMAAVFSAFTVEAFLNHVGKQKLADWETKERKLSPRDKLSLLRREYGWSFERQKRPYATIDQMLDVRDALAHGKTETVKKDVVLRKHPPDLDPWLEPDWKKLCEAKSVSRMVGDAEAIVRDLYRQSGGSRDPFASLGGGSSGISLEPPRTNISPPRRRPTGRRP